MLLAFLLCGLTAFAQVTTSSISGLVVDSKGEGLPGATVVAVHVSSGSRYGTVTNALGRYNLPAVRVGGPFRVTVSYTGFQEQSRESIFTNLGVTANVDFSMTDNTAVLGEATVVAARNDIFSNNRTGAASTFDNRTISTAPAIGSRGIGSVTKYNPNGNGSSFGGQDSRLNNFTIDGSVFNNGFGLGTDAQAGGRTGSTAISLDAIEELQVNVAPFDVRQTGFVGSGINAVTRSGTNDITGSVYYFFRNNNMVGDEAAGKTLTITKFDEKVLGARLGGSIIKDKAFYFVSYEQVDKSEPAHAFKAKGSSISGTETRVEQKDLQDLSTFLKDKFNYTTGPWEGFNNEIASRKFLARFDLNINNANKLTLSYKHHDSESDQLISNSASAGAGARRSNTSSMSYQNSGYTIQDNTRSVVADLQTTLSDKIHNNFIAGFDKQIEDRGYLSPVFPTIDILDPTTKTTYISVGMDPFTPSNKLNYYTFHATDNVTLYMGKHTVTAGLNYEKYKSNNLFFPASNGVYVYNSLADFYTAANAYLDNPQNAVSPVKARFQYRYSAIAGGAEPLQVLNVNKFDLYGQDAFEVSKNFKLTVGLRAGLISFGKTSLPNKTIADSTFVGLDGQRNYKINTDQMPKATILWEPRIGFNWDVAGDKKTQIRGGAGIFTGRPPYVWVSNQVGNNGVLTGFIDQSNTDAYKFSPDASVFTPATPTLPTTFDIAASDPDYKFPQVIKTNIALDRKLWRNLVGSLEFLFNKNLNAVQYFDANYKPSTARFAGPDQRARYAGNATNQRVVKNVSRAAIMTNTNEGYYFGSTFKLEYPNQKGLSAMLAYTYSQAKDIMSAGSIASGSFTSLRTVNGGNSPELALADQDLPNRFVSLINYRFEYGGKFGGATQVSLGYVGENRAFNSTTGINTSRFSYAIGGDMNGDGIQNNDLLFVPNKGSDLTFEDLTVKIINPANPTGPKIDKIYTAAEQAAAFDAFIEQDPYLKTRRGQYTERNGGLFPFVHQFDLSVAQEFFIKVGGKRNTIQVRADILNMGNLVNSDWGVGNLFNSDRPISFQKVSADGVPSYKLATQIENGDPVLIKNSFLKGTSAFDVWTAQLGLRYTFN